MISLTSKSQKTSTGKGFLSRCLGILVTVVTAVETMITPVVAAVAEAPNCGMDEHAHVAECYTSQSNLICGMEESDEHTHGDECYQGVLELTCTLPEHVHTDVCYGASSEDTAPDTEADETSNNWELGGVEDSDNSDASEEDDIPAPDEDPPAKLSISKLLTNEHDIPRESPYYEGVTFRYVIFKGDAVFKDEYFAYDYAEGGLAEILHNSNNEFTVVELNIDFGNSESDAVVLNGSDSNLVQYKVISGANTMSGYEFEETNEPWVWEPDAEYHIVEVEGDLRHIAINLVFGSIIDSEENKADGHKYTFTYDPDKELSITGINRLFLSGEPKGTIRGSKTWVDDNDRYKTRPGSITVTITPYIEGALTEPVVVDDEPLQPKTMTVTAEDGWEWVFDDLPLSDDKGRAIVYGIEEDTSEISAYYKSEVHGWNITNTSRWTYVEGSKTWNDNDDQDGKRPSSITINLLADGKKIDSKTVTEGDGWSWGFENLPRFDDEDGHEIKYTITEDNVPPGYTFEVDGYNVTNTHGPEKTKVSFSKTWNDNDDQDGKRPASIVINLYANGELKDSATVTEGDGWSHTFDNLDKYANGEEIYYLITEDVVAEYTSEFNYDEEINHYEFTNTHTPEKTFVEGSKTWDDNNNQDGKRPKNITIKLYANLVFKESKTVSEADGWSWTFKDLPKYEGGETIEYTIEEDEVEGYTHEIKGYNVVNTLIIEKTSVFGTKTWDDDNNRDGKRPDSIRINLWKQGWNDKYGTCCASTTASERTGWWWSFTDLPKYEDGHLIEYSITESTVDGYTRGEVKYEDTIDGIRCSLTNTHTPEKTFVEGSKTWDDNDDQDGKRPASIVINLYADGTLKDSATVTEGDGWYWIFDDLDKYANGEEINYTIKEEKVDDYTSVVNGYDVVNTHTPEKTKVEGSKTWDDDNNRDGKRPDSIVISLYANGKHKEDKTVTEGDGWSWTFDNLDKYSDGELIKYTIIEDEVAEYKSKVDSYNVTNTHEIEKTFVSGSKTWNDSDNHDGKRPKNITIKLYANLVFKESKTVSEADGWSWTFKDLPKYEGGETIEYTIEEDEVEGYTHEINGYNVTNTHKIEKTKVEGSKTWDDNENQDGKRPAEITINLLADGKKIDSKTVTKANGWSWTFDNLDKYANGKEIEYTIKEEKVDDYTSVVNGYNVTNTHKIEKTSVTGIKIWNDNNNQDGKRPTEITINLLADGKKIDSKTVTKANGWMWTFDNLDKYAKGKEIEYTIKEEKVDDYTSVVNGYNVTNTHTPEKTKVEGSKTWADNDNQDGKRPAEITIKLYANSVFKESKTVSEADGWKWTFDNLDKYANGEEIKYTIIEDNVDDYTPRVDGYNITNTHEIEKTIVSGIKTWNDNGNQDGVRPESITINLVGTIKDKDNKEVVVKEDSLTVTEADGWSWTFDNLDKYSDGKLIKYTITEDTVSDYESDVDGYNVTNTHTPETTSLTVKKEWVDNKNQDGKRGAVTVKLQANGKDIEGANGKEIELSNEKGWSYTWNNLPVYQDGKAIQYSVVETKYPDGYDVSYSEIAAGAKDATITVTNTHTPETVDISGTKTWNDNNNQDGKRPEQITINLLANNNKIKSQTVKPDADGNWKWEFKDLPKYANGNVIKYTITENRVEGYDTKVNGHNVTNTRTPETVDISVTKTWVDNDDQDGKRPESITINLLADGKIVDTKAVTKADGWKWTFKDLPKYKNGSVIKYTITENRVEGYTTKVNGYNVTNTRTPETVDISGTKTWVDNDDQDGKRPEKIRINLLANGVVVEIKEVTADADGNWKWTFKDLPKYKNGEEIEYTIGEDRVVGYTTKVNSYNVTNTHNTETVDISGKKTWADNDNQDGKRPDEITIKLFANGEFVDSQIVTEDANGNWEWTFEDLPKYANGEEIEYTVTENRVEGYTTKVNGYNVTNTRTPETVDISGKKTWADNDNQDGKRPDEITINLYADGEFVDSQTVTEDANGNWEWTFEGLPKYSNGNVIKYTITENRVEGYTTKVTGYNVTNTHTTETVEISGTKTWADNDNQDGKRPERIRINLLANGEVVETKVVTEGADGSWKWSFKGLPKYSNGEEIEYTISEDRVVGYTTKVTGYNVTNTRTPETVEISGSKTWADNNNQDGKRPERIRINLLANGEVVETKVVTEGADGSWKWTFKGLPKYSNGEEIEYTITEGRVEGYSTKVNGYNVTNTYTPETVDISGKKTWADNDNQDGKRPDKIRINLLANGEVVDYQIVTEDENGNWEWSFEDLPKYADGEEIEYTITENRVEGYTTKINGYNVTNTHTTETVEISGTKTWADNDNQDGKRPDKIRINLLANGEVVETKVVTEGADGSWKWSFKGLPKYADGEEIVYTITENRVDGYSAKVDGYNVTNTHTPETVEISGSKTWVDDDNRDGKRPERIRINLLADGVIVETKVITEDANGNWKWSFKGLPKYSDGVEIKYTITENRVEGYTTKVDGYNVTNTHTPETVAISGSKTWVDNDNQDGKRPDKIKINLFADGVFVESKVVTEGADGSWKWTFRGLPKYADGVEIVYTVTEDNVKGYTAVVNGYNVTNTYTPETISLSGEKTWVDNNDQDGKRPDGITINLVGTVKDKDNKEVVVKEDSLIVKADKDGNWEWKFEKLPKYASGQEIVYSITEDPVEGYIAEVKDYNVTNTHKPETVDIAGTKTWLDNNNQDGKRPDSITINLLADGTVVATKTVTEADGWKWSFEDLDKYSDGKLIVYTITEDEVKGYTTVVDGYNVTNTYEPTNTPETTSISGVKTWIDDGNRYGRRPVSIAINLFADGEFKEKKNVTAMDGWRWTFDNLPVYANGKKIIYTITEDYVAGYVTVIDGYNVINTIISNAPETVFVSGHKIWEDNDNHEGARPSYITVRLLADGRVIRTINVTEADGWSWYFGGLPKYNGYQIINYTIEEEPVKDYVAFVDGYNIINYYGPDIVVEIPVEGITNEEDVNVEKDEVGRLGMIVMMVLGLAAVFFGTVNSKKDEER